MSNQHSTHWSKGRKKSCITLKAQHKSMVSYTNVMCFEHKTLWCACAEQGNMGSCWIFNNRHSLRFKMQTRVHSHAQWVNSHRASKSFTIGKDVKRVNVLIPGTLKNLGLNWADHSGQVAFPLLGDFCLTQYIHLLFLLFVTHSFVFYIPQVTSPNKINSHSLEESHNFF